MEFSDWLKLLHPILAIGVVYPLIGLVLHYAWQVRSRRLAEPEAKRGISPQVGLSHVGLGRWLAAAVVGVALVGLVYSILIKQPLWQTDPLRSAIVTGVCGLTIAAYSQLNRAKSKGWRLVYALLSMGGLVWLGEQKGVFRRADEWWVSHYYYGMTAAMLMIVAIAIVPEIYRHITWRRLHIGLNILAVLRFLGQALTGTRDLLEIPLGWQESTIYQCDFIARSCSKP